MWPPPFDDARSSRSAVGSDAQLTCQVTERIRDDHRLTAEGITVEVRNRVVTLAGTVSSLYARVAAAELARTTPGVADICNRLQLARSADVTLAMRDLRPDPFDELVANWDDEPDPPAPARPVRTVGRWLDAAAAALGRRKPPAP